MGADVTDFLNNNTSGGGADVGQFLGGGQSSLGAQDQALAQHVSQQKQLQEQYGGVGQQALAGTEALAQGFAGPVATLAEKGLSSLGVPGLSPEEQEARAQANPGTQFLGQTAGLGAGFLTGTGEAAVLTKAGELGVNTARLGEATSVGGKIASAALRAGIETAVLQAGDETSKVINNGLTNDPGAMLGNAAINIGLAGILGGVGGGALGSVSPLWNATVGPKADAFLNLLKNKTSGVGLPVDATFKTFLENAKAEGFKIAPEIKARLSQDPDAVRIFQQLLENGASQAEALKGAIADTQAVAKGQIATVMSGGEENISAFEAGEHAKETILTKANDLNDEVQNKYSSVGDAKAIQIPDNDRLKFYDNLITQGQEFGANGSPQQQLFKVYGERALAQDTIGQLDKLNTEIGGELSKSWRAGDTETYKALAQIRDGIRDFQDKQVGRSVAELVKPTKVGGQKGMLNQVEELAGVAEHHDIAQEIVNGRQEARKAYSEFMDKLSDMASMGKAGKIKNFSQFEEAIQSIPSSKLAGRLFDPKNVEALRSLKAEYPDLFETIVKQQKMDIIEGASKAGELNHNTVLNKVNSLPKEVKKLMFSPEELEKLNSAAQTIKELNLRINPSGTAGTLAGLWKHIPAGAGGLISMMSGHGLIGGIMAGQAVQLFGKDLPNMAKLAILKSMGGAEEKVSAEATKSMVDYFRNIARGQNTLTRATTSFFKAGAEVLPEHLIPTQESRNKLEKSLEYHSSDPNNLTNVGGSIVKYLPNHGSELGSMTVKATGYLNSLKPKQNPMGPFDTKPPIDKAAQAKYNRALDIAQQPLMALKYAKDGTLLPQDVQTLNTIYPGLHSQIASKLSDELINHHASGGKIPYSTRLQLEQLIGSTPMDGSTMPSNMQAIIKSAAPQQQPQQGPQAHKKASGVELRQINKVNNMYKTGLETRASNREG